MEGTNIIGNQNKGYKNTFEKDLVLLNNIGNVEINN